MEHFNKEYGIFGIFSSPELKAHGRAYSIARHSSSVRRRRPSTFSNDIFSEAMKSILAIFHI